MPYRRTDTALAVDVGGWFASDLSLLQCRFSRNPALCNSQDLATIKSRVVRKPECPTGELIQPLLSTSVDGSRAICRSWNAAFREIRRSEIAKTRARFVEEVCKPSDSQVLWFSLSTIYYRRSVACMQHAGELIQAFRWTSVDGSRAICRSWNAAFREIRHSTIDRVEG